ncbi:MAG: hypothetical protein ACXVLF_11495 [Flavisolibacter sp.]
MSFEANDMNTIHLGNYEEFFILYMDNELSEDQVKMVDEFLVAHPDLKAEFEILMSTKLPMEEFSFDKKDLLADNMKLSSVDEELLLYIDNELPSDKKKTVEFELASNKHYQLEHQLLLKTKLDRSEAIPYPDKKELYRRTERVVSMKVWMRVAAAAVIIVVAGIVYFENPPSVPLATDGQNTAGVTSPSKNLVKQKDTASAPVLPVESQTKNDVAVTVETKPEESKNVKYETRERKADAPVENVTAYTPQQPREDVTVDRPLKTNVVPDNSAEKLLALNAPKDIINSGSVTSVEPDRKTIKDAPDDAGESANRKGSLKGFLRKATRVIQRRTGIDPTNGNGDLLIGSVAINLK